MTEPQQTLGVEQSKDQLFIIKTLIIFRMAVVTFFLGAVIVFQLMFGGLSLQVHVSLLISVTYILSIVYLFLLTRIRRYIIFLSFQLAVDLLIETAIIYSTGGLASPFTFLYILTIIASSIVLPRPAAYVAASNASILYGVLVNLEFYGIIAPPHLLMLGAAPKMPEIIFFTVLIHIAAFYLVAFLSDFLSQRLWRTLIALMTKSRDLTYLQAFHENVLANMGGGFLALDMDRHIISANEAAELILGRPLGELRMKTVAEIFGALPDYFLQEVDGADAGTTFEWPYNHDGSRRILSMSSTLFRDSSREVRGFIVIFQDVTHIKKMEEQVTRAEHLAAIGRISAGLAHEIRNPLGSISGSIQMLKAEATGDVPPHHEKLMGIILRETDRLNRIISNFLVSSTASSKKAKGVHLAKLIQDTVLLFRNDATYASHVTVATALDDTVAIEADAEGIKQVFWNLLINAAQAMKEGGEVTITMTRDGDVCVVTVADTGSGIAEEERKRIFDPFYTTKEKGSGLGLSTVLKIVENHHGLITIDNGIDGGAMFTIRLPIS